MKEIIKMVILKEEECYLMRMEINYMKEMGKVNVQKMLTMYM